MLEVNRNSPGTGNILWENKTSAIKDQADDMKETDPMKPFHELAGGKSFPSSPEQYKNMKGDIENQLKALKKDKDLDAVVGDFIDPEKPPAQDLSSKPPERAPIFTVQQNPQSAGQTGEKPPHASTGGTTEQAGEKPPHTPTEETDRRASPQQTPQETPEAEGSGPQVQRDENSASSIQRAGQQAENSQGSAGNEEKPPHSSSAGIRRPAGMAHRAERTEQTQGEKPPGNSSGRIMQEERRREGAETTEQSTDSRTPDTTSERPARRPAGRSQRATTEQQTPGTQPEERQTHQAATPAQQSQTAQQQSQTPQGATPPERSIIEASDRDFSTRGTGSRISTPDRTITTSDVTTTSSATRLRVTDREVDGAAEANRQRDRSASTTLGPVHLSSTLSTRQEAAASGHGSLPSDSSPGNLSGTGSAGLSVEHRVAARYRGVTASHTRYIRDGVSGEGRANIDPQRIQSGESPIDVQRGQVEGRIRLGEERRLDLPGGSFFRVRNEYDQGADVDIENSRTDTSHGRDWNHSRRESLQGSINAGLSQTIEGRNDSGSGLSMTLRGNAGIGEGGAFERGISRDERGIHLQVGGALPIKTPFGADGRLRVDISQQDIERARIVADSANTVIEGVQTSVANGVSRVSERAGEVREDINRGARRVGNRIEAARDSFGNWIRGDD
ncbi:MAG: hypothetical protein ABRQ38_01570 [Candidatus Eremiobacterota bacterium]